MSPELEQSHDLRLGCLYPHSSAASPLHSFVNMVFFYSLGLLAAKRELRDRFGLLGETDKKRQRRTPLEQRGLHCRKPSRIKATPKQNV